MSDTIIVKVKTIDDKTIECEINPSETILILKQEIQKQLDISPDRQRLLYQGRHLKNDEKLVDCGIESGSVVHLVQYNPPPSSEPPPATTAAQQYEEVFHSQLNTHSLLHHLRRRRLPRRRDIALGERYETIRQNLQTLESIGMSQESTGTPNFRRNLHVKQWIDVIDTVDQWLEAQIVDKRETGDREEVYVHYNGWPEHWDEWIDVQSPRIQPMRTHTLQSMRSPMASPHPVVRPDAVRLQAEGQSHNFTDYVQQSVGVMDSVKQMLEHYLELKSRNDGQGDPDMEEDLSRASSQVIPLLDRTGRLMTDLSRCMYRTTNSQDGILPPMPSQREIHQFSNRSPGIEIHIYNNVDAPQERPSS